MLLSTFWHLHPRSCSSLGTTLRFPAFAPYTLGAFLRFPTFAPLFLSCSGYYTTFSGIYTLHSGYFALFLGICTLVPILLWVLYYIFWHLHPAPWVFCSCSWRLHPRSCFVLGTILRFLAFAPSLLFCSGYYTPFSGICTLVPVLLWVLHSVFRHLHPRSCFALGTTLRFPAFAPSLLFCSGCYTPFSGICTLHPGYFALVLGVCTLALALFWVPHSVFRHLHPCSCFALGVTFCLLIFTPMLCDYGRSG